MCERAWTSLPITTLVDGGERPQSSWCRSVAISGPMRYNCHMIVEHTGDAAQDLIGELGRKYVWWEPIGDEPHSEERIIGQAMNFGTFDDTRRLEKTLGYDRLAK